MGTPIWVSVADLISMAVVILRHSLKFYELGRTFTFVIERNICNFRGFGPYNGFGQLSVIDLILYFECETFIGGHL